MSITRAKTLINNGYFAPGKSYNKKQFTKLALQVIPNLHTSRRSMIERERSDLDLVKAQGYVNRTLHNMGMHLKSRNYRQEFYVVSEPGEIAKEINRCVKEASTKYYIATQLRASLTE